MGGLGASSIVTKDAGIQMTGDEAQEGAGQLQLPSTAHLCQNRLQGVMHGLFINTPVLQSAWGRAIFPLTLIEAFGQDLFCLRQQNIPGTHSCQSFESAAPGSVWSYRTQKAGRSVSSRTGLPGKSDGGRDSLYGA